MSDALIIEASGFNISLVLNLLTLTTFFCYSLFSRIYLMFKISEKRALTRLFLLGVGAPIGLDRFYEGDVTGGFLAILGFCLAVITVFGLLIWIFPFVSKTFRLLREFESAEE